MSTPAMSTPAVSAPTISAPTVSAPAAPLVAVDEIDVVSPHEVTGRKFVRADDPYLEGHYPGFTIYPGIFVIETISQTVAGLVARTWENRAGLEPAGITSVRFTAPARPGDTLLAHCQVSYTDDDLVKVRAECRNQRGVKTATARLEFRLTGVGADV